VRLLNVAIAKTDLGPCLTPNKEPVGSIPNIPAFGWVKEYFEPIGLLGDSRRCGTTEKVQPGKCLTKGAAGFLERRVC
jgi:hypothetical protein